VHFYNSEDDIDRFVGALEANRPRHHSGTDSREP